MSTPPLFIVKESLPSQLVSDLHFLGDCTTGDFHAGDITGTASPSELGFPLEGDRGAEERDKGVEPSSSAWEADALPMC